MSYHSLFVPSFVSNECILSTDTCSNLHQCYYVRRFSGERISFTWVDNYDKRYGVGIARADRPFFKSVLWTAWGTNFVSCTGIRKKLRDTEFLSPREQVFYDEDKLALVHNMWNALAAPLRLYDESKTRTHTRIPIGLDDGRGPVPVQRRSKFYERGLLGHNIQSNRGLLEILRHYAQWAEKGNVNVLLVDVGIFDRTVKVLR